MAQTDIEPVSNGCRHMRARYKMQRSNKSPFPEKRLIRFECEKGYEINNSVQENLQKCLGQKMGCWREE